MNDITPVDTLGAVESPIEELRKFKEEKTISSGETFTFGSKHGLVRAFVGREPWSDDSQSFPNSSDDSLAVGLQETSFIGLRGITSRLQLVVGKEEGGSFYIENLSKVKEGSKGIPFKVIVPSLAEPVFLNPQKENTENLDSKCSIGSVNKLKGVQILWGPKFGDFAFSLKILHAVDSKDGWEAEVRFLYHI